MKALLFANTDWYLYNFRLSLAEGLRERGFEVVLLSPPGSFSSKLQQCGFEWREFDFARKGTNPVLEIATLNRLKKLYKAIKPDVAHHFTIKCVLYGGIVARHLRIPTISALTGTGHLFTVPSLKNALLKPLISHGYRYALRDSEVIFQNPDDRDAFLRLGLSSPAQSHLIRGSGVNMARFRPPARRLDNQRMRVLMVCRLIKEKGVAEFVEAARLVRQHHPNVSFEIAGVSDPGNPSALTPEQIDSWSSNGDAEFLGHVSEMDELFQASDVCVLPSYYGEGVPRSLIEAAASGLPLVSTDTPGCREICRDSVNGFLVPPRNPIALATAISKLIADADLRTKFGGRSREIAEEEFAEEKVVGRTIAIYDLATAKLAH